MEMGWRMLVGSEVHSDLDSIEAADFWHVGMSLVGGGKHGIR
jgi:hypothetical protein